MGLSTKPEIESSARADLVAVIDLLHRYRKKVLDGEWRIDQTPLYQAIDSLEFAFFHQQPAEKNNIQSIEALIAQDPHFKQSNLVRADDLPYAYNARFLYGCTRIGHPL